MVLLGGHYLLHWNLNWKSGMFTKVSPSSYIQISISSHPAEISEICFHPSRSPGQGVGVLSLQKSFSGHVQVGVIQQIEVNFVLENIQGSFSAGLSSLVVCPQMPWRLLFSICVLVCVLFPCTIVLKNVLKEKARMNVDHLLYVSSLKELSVDCCPVPLNIQMVSQIYTADPWTTQVWTAWLHLCAIFFNKYHLIL